ncbi:MAG: hypothetical protein HY703_07665 [Gemmatimonadetes bacterium]|nr:hypothetical protein [Gemmatimonadota bacterium]
MLAGAVTVAGCWAAARPAHAQTPPEAGNTDLPTRTTTIDPCLVATAGQLRLVLAAGLDAAFPVKPPPRGGHNVTISDPDLQLVDCPGPRLEARARIQERHRRGPLRRSTSGQFRFASRADGQLTYAVTALPGPIPESAVRRALICLSEIRVLGLDLEKTPDWLDRAWIEDQLNAQLRDQACADITGLVRAYLASGGQLQESR